MNILYGNNRGKKKLYESFLDDVNEKIVDELPEDLPPDDAEEISEGYWLKESDLVEDDIPEEVPLDEGGTKNPTGLGAELEEIEDLYNEFGAQGFYNVKFSNFLKEFPLFGKEVILSFIKEMEIRTPEEMEDEETVETDWATGELIIKEDWPCLLNGARRMVNGRGKNNKHWVLWKNEWKKYYKAYDESFNR